MNWHTIFKITDLSAIISSYALNILLICLIIFKTPAHMKVYSRILLQAAVGDLIHTTCIFFSQLIIASKGTAHYMFLNGIHHNLGPYFNSFLCSFYGFGMVSSVTNVTTMYIFRYFHICRQYDWRMRNHVILVLIGYLFASFQLFTTFYSCIPPRVIIENYYMAGLEIARFIHDGETSNEVIIDAVHHMGVVDLAVFEWKIAAVSLFINNIFAYMIMAICSWKIYHVVNTSLLPDETSRQIQTTMTKVLVCQAVIPTLTSTAPLIYMCVVPFLEIEIYSLSMIVAIPMSWVGVLNSISTIYFVIPYRMAVTNVVKRIFRQPNPVIVIPQSVTVPSTN